MEYAEVEAKFKLIRSPMNYFEGKGRLPFPAPENIILFHRRSFESTGLGLQTDFHYRNVLIFNFGEPINVFIDGTIIQLHGGEGFLILPFQYHRFVNEGQKHISLAFITFFMEENVYFEPLRDSTFSYHPSTMQLVSSLMDAYSAQDTRPLSSLMALILIDINISNESGSLAPTVPSSNPSLTVQICKAVYEDKSITVKELALRLGYSESYLRGHFKKAMKVSMGRFIIELRLTESMRLLSRTTHQISIVAELSGYESVYSFSRSFKTHIGLSPTQYRYKVQILNEKSDEYQFRVGNRT